MADQDTMFGIVSLVWQLSRGIKSLHAFLGDIKNASSDIQTLMQEMSSKVGVLDKLLDRLNTINPKDRNTLLVTTVRNRMEHVTKLENITRLFQMKGRDGQIKRVGTQVATVFKNESIQKHIAMLLRSAPLDIFAAQGTWVM